MHAQASEAGGVHDSLPSDFRVGDRSSSKGEGAGGRDMRNRRDSGSPAFSDSVRVRTQPAYLFRVGCHPCMYVYVYAYAYVYIYIKLLTSPDGG